MSESPQVSESPQISENAAPLLRLEAIDTYYGPIHILQEINLQVGAGELVCLLGGNASGKSTTLARTLRGGRRAIASARGWRSCPRTGASSRR
jgi:ABC-type molybdenum transport system ATPase subunit/photorepair protein PhrA